jgi:hypothetical protein
MTLDEAVDNYIPHMHGWSTPQKCKTLIRCIVETAPNNSLEIGIFGGRAIISMGFAHRHTGNGIAIGLDPWKHEACEEGDNDPENNDWWRKIDLHDIYSSFVQHVLAHNLLNYVEWLRLDSKKALKFLKEVHGPFGVIHQDGNHSEEVSSWEVEAYAPLLLKGGFWVMDDTNWPSTTKAQQKILELGFKELEDHGEWKLFQKP